MYSKQFGKIVSEFQFGGECIHAEPYGHGHVNDTYAVYFKHEFSRPVRYILQKINRNVFRDPPLMMENISGVTAHIAEKVRAGGGDPFRRTLRIIRTADGGNFYLDQEGNYWRAYDFIEDATSYQQPTPEIFERSGEAFGRFFRMLSDYPAASLHESIPYFHNTRARFDAFRDAVSLDSGNRAAEARAEIEFAFERESDAGILVDLLAAGELPLRVTHNDTKLNNVMIDNKTGEGICVIDLDTVMPGLSLYDFGDSIRFGASTGAEDEPDLSKVSLSLPMFETFARGYLSETAGDLTERELSLLPFASKLMTFESGIRFLADYLSGDVYFKTKRPGHNLDRCRTQFKIVADMEREMDSMAAIVKKYSK